MSGTDYDLEEALTGSDVLAEIGLDPGAIQDVIDDDRARRCPDRGVRGGLERGGLERSERKGAGEGGLRSHDARQPSSITRPEGEYS